MISADSGSVKCSGWSWSFVLDKMSLITYCSPLVYMLRSGHQGSKDCTHRGVSLNPGRKSFDVAGCQIPRPVILRTCDGDCARHLTQTGSLGDSSEVHDDNAPCKDLGTALVEGKPHIRVHALPSGHLMIESACMD